LLLVIFALTLAAIFFVLGAYKASSPYSFIGAERELIQMMAYEPMICWRPSGCIWSRKALLWTTLPSIQNCSCWYYREFSSLPLHA